MPRELIDKKTIYYIWFLVCFTYFLFNLWKLEICSIKLNLIKCIGLSKKKRKKENFLEKYKKIKKGKSKAPVPTCFLYIDCKIDSATERPQNQILITKPS